MWVVFFFLLGICAMHDLHNKQIPAIWIWISLGVTTLYRTYLFVQAKSSIEESILCMVPGVILLLFSSAGKQVGNGDGWLVIASGLYLEWEELIKVLCYSFFAAGIFSVGYLLVAHKNRKNKIPFVPFLFLGIMGLSLGELL